MVEPKDRALADNVGQEKAAARRRGTAERLMAIGRRSAARPVRDDRSPEEIIGYDETGLPR